MRKHNFLKSLSKLETLKSISFFQNRIFFLLFFIIIIFSFRCHAQILEVDPEELKKVTERSERIGVSLSGSTGLITIQTPNFRGDTKASISFKGDISRHSSTLGTTIYNVWNQERYAAFSYAIKPNLELSLNYLNYNRSSSPYLAELNYSDDHTGGGLKYSTHHGKQDFCMGVSFAPMTSSELNRSDVSQLENLRNVYITISECISSNIEGFLHLKESFTQKQKIALNNGAELRINRKEFLIGAIGLEYSPMVNLALITEVEFFNYRDLFRKNSDRHSINTGIRVGREHFQLELIGLSLSINPRVLLGATIGF